MKIIGEKQKKPSRSGLTGFLLKHKAVFFLVIIIGLLLLYFELKIKDIKSTQVENMKATVEKHNQEIDSVETLGLSQTVTVFSWAVRSELIRDNIEQVNQLFQAFIKEKGVQQIDLINPESSVIILSTDMKQKGQAVSDEKIMRVDTPISIKDSLSQKVIVPIMGLEKRIGVLVIRTAD